VHSGIIVRRALELMREAVQMDGFKRANLRVILAQLATCIWPLVRDRVQGYKGILWRVIFRAVIARRSGVAATDRARNWYLISDTWYLTPIP